MRARLIGFLALLLLAIPGTGWTQTVAPSLKPPTRAPDFTGITHWINSPPLSMRKLRGKVVLVDFWAYSCINCLRTFPHLKAWWAKYHKDGLVIVGVHSPEFTFGKNHANVERAVKRFGLTYPIAMDSHLATWNAWHNQYWPAEYLVGRDGKVLSHHYGEGQYRESENAIRKALGLAPLTHAKPAKGPDFARIGSPEMYFGLAREAYMGNDHGPSRSARDYRMPARLAFNHYGLAGTWRMTDQYALLTRGTGTIRLRYGASEVNMVAASHDGKPITLRITVDGKRQPDVTVNESRMYTLFTGGDYRQHVITIQATRPGLEAYTFTFG